MWRILRHPFVSSVVSRNTCRFLTHQPNPSLKVSNGHLDHYSVGDKMHGYTVVRVEDVPELSLTAYDLHHEYSGADHLHISRDDPNNCFCVTLRTTPKDSTGVAHILEHLALCGSERYPCRDPFMKMTNRSLATFMNAMTWPDATSYPFSSQNQKDFSNLMNVYLDAVFFPHLRYLDFRQEGWRLEYRDLHDKNSEIGFKGVVFNEMKGAFSSSSQLYYRHLLNQLFPDSTYANESGGDPLEIPNLSYEGLKEFYARHYHPSNSKFFTYGNFPLESHLSLINQRVLSRFPKNESHRKESEVPKQSKWSQPKEANLTCAPDSFAPFPEKQTTVSLSYLMSDIKDTHENFVLGILSYLLSDGPNSPFYESLITSGLGMDYSPGQGYTDFTRQSFFSIGLTGIHENDVEKVEQIILDTFKKAAEDGFPEERIDALLHLIEIGLKHQTTSFGLHLAMKLNSLLNHDGDTSASLHIMEKIEKFRENLSRDPDYLKKKVKEHFLDNSHRLKLVMSPSKDFLNEYNVQESQLLERKVSQLKAEDREKVYTEGLELSENQKKEDDASVLPTLNVVTDISRQLDKPVLIHHKLKNIDLQTSPQKTNGINYFKLLFSIPSDGMLEDLPYIRLFASLITRVGAGVRNHKEMDQEINMTTTGLGSKIHISDDAEVLNDYQKGLYFTSYSLERNFQRMLNLWTDIITKPNFGQDLDHLSQLIKMSAADLSDSIAGSGQKYAMTRSASFLTPAAKIREEMTGLSYASFLKKISEKNDMSDLIYRLDIIRNNILRREHLKISVNAEDHELNRCLKTLESFVDQIPLVNPEQQTSTSSSETFQSSFGVKEHHVLEFNTNYVGKSITTVPFLHPDYAALRIAAKLVSAKFLLREVREMGGAYGGGAGLTSGGIFNFYSYRDPKTVDTLEKFEEASGWLSDGKFRPEDVDEAKLATFQSVDSPVAPESKGNLLFLENMSYEQRHQHRLQLLDVTKDDIIRVSQTYLKNRKNFGAAIIGPQNDQTQKGSGWKIVNH